MYDHTHHPRCLNCGSSQRGWCVACRILLQRTPLCLQIHPLAPHLTAVSTATHTGILREAIHALKYHGVHVLASVLGARLAQAVRQMGWPAAAITPVPLHPNRLAQRGFNQSQLIAAHCAPLVRLPITDGLVLRQRDTLPQVGQSAEDRRTNLDGAFCVQSAPPSPVVLLIDDVLTTGATLQACATALLTAGVQTVLAAVITAAQPA